MSEDPAMPQMVDHAFAGGIFLASRDPERLIAWFRDAMGIPMEGDASGGMAMLPCGDHGTVLGVQPARDDAPQPPPGEVEAEPYGRQPMMCNIRVTDIDATLATLQAAGSATAGPADYPGIGRFAWTRTPDGHDIELWQP